MKKASFILAATSLGVEAYRPYYSQRYISSGNVMKATGQPAYLPGNDGLLATAVELTPSVNIWYQYYTGTPPAEGSMIYTSLELAPDTFPETVALSPYEGTLRNLFTSTYSASYSGAVQFYQGEYSSWSLQQTLSPPSKTVDVGKNYFGSTLAFDRDDYDTLFVGCGNCSTSAGKGRGAIYLYKQDRSSGKQSWSQTQVITADKLYGLGGGKLVVSDDLLMTTTSSHGPVLFRKVKGDYVAEQLLSAPGGVSNFDVYDNTIAISYTGASKGPNTNVGVVYMLASAKPAPVKGKAMPLQWSVQQVLYPTTVENDLLFGAKLSLDGDRLAISNGGVGGGATSLAYIYERASNGKWSVQQTLSDLAGTQSANLFLRGSSLMTLQNASKIAYYDQYASSADCLTLQLEDDFGDGWDTARLTVTAPDGSKEYYHSRCDLVNPHKVRYCPYDTTKGGIYHFNIPDSVKAKNHWEITWRVFDENTAKWYIGSHDSKMDFEWDPVYQHFTPRLMHKIRTNITCEYCTPPPTDKPTPVLRSRALKGGDDVPVWPNTAHPTPTPGPTLATTLFENWRTMTLYGADAWHSTFYRAYYYVSDAKSQRLITSGTLCPGEATGKKCWVELPDGEYNIRVGGDTLASSASLFWTFCHSANQIPAQTQLSIKIEDGKCLAPLSHAHTSFCKGVAGATTATATIQMEFVVLGVGSSVMGDVDRVALTNAVAYAFTGLTKSDVSINSVTASSGGLYVSVNVAMSDEMGYDVLSLEGVDSLVTSIQTYMRGHGPSVIWSGLQSAEHHTIFSTSTSVQFISAEVVGSGDKLIVPADAAAVDEVVNYIDQPFAQYKETPQSDSSSLIINSVSVSGYFLAVAGVAALVVGMFVASRRAAKSQNTPSSTGEQYVELEATEHTGRVQLKDLKLAAPNVADLKQFVESEDEVLKMMLARGK